MIIRSKAPLRLGLAGGGTDLDVYSNKYKGNVLNATISLYVYCTIEIRHDNKILFNSTNLNQIIEVDSKDYLELNGKGDILKAVYNRVIKEYIKTPLSFSMHVYSDVESGTGLGGSSTLVVAMINAFVEWFNLPLGAYDIAKLAYQIEREDLGIVGGAQDQYAATFGGINFIEFFSKEVVIVNPLRIKKWIINELEASTVLYYTGLTRSANQIEKEKKNLVSNKTSLDAMHKIKDIAISMKQDILEGDIQNFAFNLEKSWDLKKTTSDTTSNIEIDKIYSLAKNNGAYSGKITGAGGGGFFFFIIDPIKKKQLVEALNLQQGNVFNFKFVEDGASAWKI